MNIKWMTLLILTFFISSCAGHKTAVKKVEAEIKQQPVVERTEMAESAREYILKSQTMSEQQKTDLIALQEKASAEAKVIDEEINKTRMVLVKSVLQPKVNEKEIVLLRKKIKKLIRKGMELENKSFTMARKIIDPLKEARDREFLYNSFIMRRRSYYW